MKAKSFFFSSFKWALLPVLAVGLFVTGCKEDEDMPDGGADVIASFQYEVSADNFLQVTFSNFSQNAASYAWDFGDGNTSTEKDPVHTYAEAGLYTVGLTATGSDGTVAVRQESIEINDPDAVLTLLAGADSKTWYLQREGIALGVGPAAGDNSYWSFGGVTPLGDRPCILDDQYTFRRDGKFEFNSNGTIFIDSEGNGGWLAGSPEGCYEETEPGIFTASDGTDVSAFANGGDYNYDFNANNGTITIEGLGAYIGLANKTGAGDNYVPQSVKEYQVLRLADGPIADTLAVALVGNGLAWNFYLVSYDDPNNLPDIPMALPSANFTFVKTGDFTVEFTSTSNNATSYMWDFGDGATSMETNPVHTYAAEGEYTVTLTVGDGQGNTDQTSKTVQISTASFSADVLSNADGKVWRLAGENSFYVGPFEGSSEWWPGLDAAGVDLQSCRIDDEFIFTDGGSMEYDALGQIWYEDYMGGSNICADESAVTSPFDVLTSGVHAFSVTDATATDPALITVTGDGAFIGFSKPFNGGELNVDTPPRSEITYRVLEYTNSPTKETITLTVDISADLSGTAWWTIVMESLK